MSAGFANELYLLEAAPAPHRELEHGKDFDEEGDCQGYNVLIYEEGNWGFGSKGPPEVRTTPNEVLGRFSYGPVLWYYDTARVQEFLLVNWSRSLP